jgi:hypothetical protein
MFFRPFDDLFERGLGAAAGQLINAAIFRDSGFNGASSSTKVWIYSFIK